MTREELKARRLAEAEAIINEIVGQDEATQPRTLSDIGQCHIGVSSLWRRVQGYGARLLETAQHEAAQVRPERVQLGAAARDHAVVKGVSLDGGW